jgi:hypothetical protein
MIPVAAIIPLATAAMELLERALPEIEAAVNRGEITKELQMEVRLRFESLRKRTAGEFSGPEWAPSGAATVGGPAEAGTPYSGEGAAAR